MRKLQIFMLVAVAACGKSSGGHHTELRTALDRSNVSLVQSVTIAEQSLQLGAGVNARIVPAADQWAIGALTGSTKHDVRVDFRGKVVASSEAPGSTGCTTQITLAEALAIAEKAAGGDAVAVVPDDDDACMREIQVLVDTTLWEVKVGPTGSVIEKELSDEEL